MSTQVVVESGRVNPAKTSSGADQKLELEPQSVVVLDAAGISRFCNHTHDAAFVDPNLLGLIQASLQRGTGKRYSEYEPEGLTTWGGRTVRVNLGHEVADAVKAGRPVKLDVFDNAGQSTADRIRLFEPKASHEGSRLALTFVEGNGAKWLVLVGLPAKTKPKWLALRQAVAQHFTSHELALEQLTAEGPAQVPQRKKPVGEQKAEKPKPRRQKREKGQKGQPRPKSAVTPNQMIAAGFKMPANWQYRRDVEVCQGWGITQAQAHEGGWRLAKHPLCAGCHAAKRRAVEPAAKVDQPRQPETEAAVAAETPAPDSIEERVDEVQTEAVREAKAAAGKKRKGKKPKRQRPSDGLPEEDAKGFEEAVNNRQKSEKPDGKAEDHSNGGAVVLGPASRFEQKPASELTPEDCTHDWGIDNPDEQQFQEYLEFAAKAQARAAA